MAAFVRLGLIAAGYVLAAIVTGFVVTASLHWDTGSSGDEARRGFFGFGVFVSFFVTYFAAAPAAVTVALGEYKAWRMWWYYAVAGAAIGLALGTLFRPPAFFPWLGLGFGPVSGLIFWSVAGRNAGLTVTRERRAVVIVMCALALFTTALSAPSLFGLGRY